MNCRYLSSRKWYKGNTHVHSTRSDGGKTVQEVSAMYRDAGYDFLAFTDHWNAFRSTEHRISPGILALDGIEIDGKDANGHYYHVVALGTLKDMDLDANLERSIETLLAQDAFLILAHPYWSGNKIEDVRRFPFGAIEIYNHVCNWLNGKGSSHYLWDVALEERLPLHGIASDDAHLLAQHPGWNGGWVMVQAETLTQNSILEALRKGRFYSTTGPLFHAITCEEHTIACSTSPIVRARLVGQGYLGERVWDASQKEFSECTFHMDASSRLSSSAYVRLEIEDASGNRAWTNPLFVHND